MKGITISIYYPINQPRWWGGGGLGGVDEKFLYSSFHLKKCFYW